MQNQTKAVFKNIDIGSQYLVSVVAYSNGGSSEPARVQRQITLPRILPPTKHVWMIAIIVFVAIIVFSLFGAAFYIYHRNAKRTRYERRCKYFEVSINYVTFVLFNIIQIYNQLGVKA